MSADYGKRMGSALLAVLQLQSDSVRLLRDIDKSLQGYRSLLGNVVTLDLGSSINRQNFIAEGLLRHYSRDGDWGHVHGINICYYDQAKPERLPEPIIVVANFEYLNPAPDAQEKLKRAWDPWYAFLEWSPERKLNEVMFLDPSTKRDSLSEGKFVAAPLFTINNIDVATSLIDLVGRP